MDWQDLMMVLGGSDERGRPLRGYYQFDVKQNNYIYPQYMLIDCIYHLQYSSLCKINGVLTLGNVSGSGDFDMPLSNLLCFSTQPAHGVVCG